jgi:hypothetical protein
MGQACLMLLGWIVDVGSYSSYLFEGLADLVRVRNIEARIVPMTIRAF